MKRRGIDRQKQKTFYGQRESKQCKAHSSISKAHSKDRGLAHRENLCLWLWPENKDNSNSSWRILLKTRKNNRACKDHICLSIPVWLIDGYPLTSKTKVFFFSFTFCVLKLSQTKTNSRNKNEWELLLEREPQLLGIFPYFLALNS